MSFTEVCSVADLVENSGVCVLVAGQQVALFQIVTGSSTALYAIGNYDPIGAANVLSRGIVGSVGDRLVVASPLYKQHFCLQSGQCLQEPQIQVPVYAVQLRHDKVWISGQPLALQATAA